MIFEGLLTAKNKTVGLKQTVKAVEKGAAQQVFVARDAERHVVKPLLDLCVEKDIPVVEVDSMKTLGKACNIEVNCAAAAILRD